MTLEQAQSFIQQQTIEPTAEIVQELQKIGLEQIKSLTLFAELTTTRREKQVPKVRLSSIIVGMAHRKISN